MQTALMTRYRYGKLVLRIFIFVLILVSSILPAVSAAAVQSAGELSEADQQTYRLLASGNKVQQERAYTKPGQPTVYLTFDDGPSALTPQVLDILKDAGVRASFFALGQSAKKYPDTIKRIINEGHALGNHTYDHVYKSLYGDFSNFWRQVQAADDVFADIAGVRPRLLRAPGGTGNFDAFYFYLLDQAGYSVFDWNIDSGDSRRANVPADEIISTVQAGPFPEEVTVLMHDGSGHSQTVKALPEIIRIFKDKGYRFATLSERVKPVQFRLGKSKWPESMPEDRFAALLAETRQTADRQQEPADSSAASGTRDTGTAAGSFDQPDNSVPLTLKLNTGNMTVPAGSYELAQGHLQVPLRLLAGQLGAAVSWSEQSRTASVRYGFRDIRYDLTSMTLRYYAFGQLVRENHLPEMKLTDGSIYVPLRAAASMLGYEVDGYSMDTKGRFVSLRPQQGLNVGRETIFTLAICPPFSL